MSLPISSTSASEPATHGRRGFALIITIILLALLVMVLVSLATLTRIEAGVGENSLKMAQAHQNARFALDQALGELQRFAGPDTRITATADITPAPIPGQRYWTGVWDAGAGGLSAIRWLVSGEGPQPNLAMGEKLLVGPVSAGNDATRHVTAPLVDLEAPSPDGSGEITVGRYAWWVGDEGVKASLALRDRSNEVDYGPYGSSELRARLRQQVPMAHQGFRATDGSGSPKQGFDPALAANASVLRNVSARSQIPLLTAASGTPLLESTRTRFHEWTTVSSGVLASTNSAHLGLKRDLSRNPELLGERLATWAAAGYMELPGVGAGFPAITNNDDVRRRYVMQIPTPANPSPGDICLGVAPVLSEFLIQFGVKRSTSNPNSIEVRVRMCVSAWNPYTSALVPQHLRLLVSGLPTIILRSDGGGSELPLNLQSAFDSIVPGGNEVHLDWSTSDNDSNADFASWLPGRVYYWRTENGTSVPDLVRYRKRVSTASGWGTTVNLSFPPGNLSIELPNSTAVGVTLRLATEATLGTTTGLEMDPISPPIMAAGPTDDPDEAGYWRFGFGFRLKQPTTDASRAWLESNGHDPRNAVVAPSQTMNYYPTDVALSPSAYAGQVVTEWNNSVGVPGVLLNRDTVSSSGTPVLSFDNDTPLFELPRSPVLSLGMLQHLRVHGARPFAIGNSWGATIEVPGVGGTIGSWWDRFFFSGLTRSFRGFGDDSWGPNLANGAPLPWYHLRIVDTRMNPDAPLALGDLRAASPHTSRFLLMDGAFNVNSTSVDAWEAVLRSLRFTAPANWSTADLNDSGSSFGGSVSSGSASLNVVIEDRTQGGIGSNAARTSGFLRFSQSVQEVFETNGPVSGIDRGRFRQGLRAGSEGPTSRQLDSIDMRGLATSIAGLVRARAAVAGPFRNMEQFVSPGTIVSWDGRSLIEQAIFERGLNAALPDFCSQSLTQADILTAIGPFFQARSDTFLIRAYGETVNPTTGEVDSRAWCEATVQRIPTTVDSTADITAEATGFGRRFVITSFRWLSPDDI
ncbi:MAG: hypothetical protein IAE82_21145 [Opitutaceae bacterium]|nr:hypothetical protein [Opitutaceae bacterium]